MQPVQRANVCEVSVCLYLYVCACVYVCMRCCVVGGVSATSVAGVGYIMRER